MTTTTTKQLISKEKSHAFKKDVYLLGMDSEGIRYWLEAATWDCGWYWGFGYVETYQNNRMPDKARDIDSHQHIDSGFTGKIDWKGEYIHNIFDCPVFTSTTFTSDEGWKLSELFKTFYTLKETAEMFHRGGASLTTNPLQGLLKNEAEEIRINKVLLPAVFAEIYNILEPKG